MTRKEPVWPPGSLRSPTLPQGEGGFFRIVLSLFLFWAYPPKMTTTPTTSDFLPDALRAAALRAPRKRPAPRRGEGVAESGHAIMLPKPAGAPRGNRNGFKHGRRSRAMRAQKAGIRLVLAKQRNLCAVIAAMLKQGVNPNGHMPALLAVAPSQDDWNAAYFSVKAAGDEQRETFSLRHDAARRRADAGRGLLGGGQAPDRAGAGQAGAGLHRGRMAGCEPDGHRVLFRTPAAQDGEIRRLRDDETLRPQRAERSVAGASSGCESGRELPRRQDLGFPGGCGAGDSAQREYRQHRRIHRGGEGQGPRAFVRRRTFLRRPQGQPGLCAAMPESGVRKWREMAGAVRHQWRHHAGGCLSHRLRS